MIVRYKKLNEYAYEPKYARPGDAAMDVYATSVSITDSYIEYGTGLAFEVPEGYAMFIFPRSSNSNKDLLLCNSVGILDSGYRGELKLRFKQTVKQVDCTPDKIYDIGDRVGQIIIAPYPKIEFKESDTLTETVRGEGGFGSTNNG